MRTVTHHGRRALALGVAVVAAWVSVACGKPAAPAAPYGAAAADVGDAVDILGWHVSVTGLRFEAEHLLVDVDATPADQPGPRAAPADLRFGLYGSLAHPIEAYGMDSCAQPAGPVPTPLAVQSADGGPARIAGTVCLGPISDQAQVRGVAGTWKDLTDNVNYMANNLTAQVRNIADVTTAVARGDLSRKITVDVKGEILELKNTINTMVDQLRSFASEVTRVAREVGTEGKLGGQADVKGVAGTWKDLTDSVNSMAGNLTGQVRNIAQVTKAVAMGDLSRKITVDVKGEILELKNTINTMVDQLNSFASEVTRVAREVGTEGKLGGQADVRGVAGTWKDLTDSVNSMAGNLTGQVRNIADVSKAIAAGDLTRELQTSRKDELGQMLRALNDMSARLRGVVSEVRQGVDSRVGRHLRWARNGQQRIDDRDRGARPTTWARTISSSMTVAALLG